MMVTILRYADGQNKKELILSASSNLKANMSRHSQIDVLKMFERRFREIPPRDPSDEDESGER